MARFERDGVSFDMPDDWRSMSVTSVSKPIALDSPDICNCLVTEEPLGESETLATRARTKLMMLARELPDFQYIDTQETTVDGRPATAISFRWGPASMRHVQRMTAVECSTPTGRAAVLISMAVSTANQETHWRDLDTLERSFRFT